VADLHPQLTFVGLFEDHSKSGGELCMRSTTTGTAVIACDSKAGSRKLASDGVTGRRARKSIDEVENCDCETLGTDLQVFSGLVHAAGRVHASRRRLWRDFFDVSPLLTSLSAILQFRNPAISATSVQRN